MRLNDLTGRSFGRLTVRARAENRGRRVFWTCDCQCGTTIEANADSLTAGRTSSCGCLRKEVTAARSTTHGHSRGNRETREYKSWQHAKGRCENPNDPKYSQYGGRGIFMDPHWRDDFAAFLADMGPCPRGHTLDRIDVDGPYAPGNCRWATVRAQAQNKQQTVWVEWDGRRMNLKQLARHLGLEYRRLHALHRRKGLPLEKAIASMRSA